MVLAAHEGAGGCVAEQFRHMHEAADIISNARPTTAKRMSQITSGCLDAAVRAAAANRSIEQAVFSSSNAFSVFELRNAHDGFKKFPTLRGSHFPGRTDSDNLGSL